MRNFKNVGLKKSVQSQIIGNNVRRMNTLENLFIVILAFYPLRHISYGLDLWDTGYNFANFQYMGTEHMDPMWLFSTYLANAMGNFLMKLPSSGSLMGMNFYTGLFASVLALLGYFFCTRQLKMPKAIAFLGEMIALSLCWCPTALLYNYMTYVMFLVSCIFLYMGLVKEKPHFLFIAGICLGINVLVRFSNLPETAMIVAVWAYDVILWLEAKKGQSFGKNDGDGEAISGKGKDSGINVGNKIFQFWPRLLRHTGWCLGGFLAALAVLFTYIHIRYGIGNYIAGIQRLFGMTDTATDYKATSMIMGMIGTYVENLYWVIRIGVILAGGMIAFMVSGWVRKLPKMPRMLWSAVIIIVTVVIYTMKFTSGKFEGFDFFLRVDGLILMLVFLIAAIGWVDKLPQILWTVAAVAMLGWLYANHFTSTLFYSYDSMLRPGVLFLMLSMFIGVVRIFHRNSSRGEKLISGMLILIILLTSLGSNNKVYPSLNNLFLAAPYTIWQSWRFVRHVQMTSVSWCMTRKKIKVDLIISAFPAKCILIAFLAMCLFQFSGFGAKFVFAESTGVQDVSATVENNEILRGIKMPAQKAVWMTEISAYVSENDLQGKEVILYGYIPSLSYYLQMPSAFNPWSDLLSYSVETMKQDMLHLEGEISEKGEEKPVIILENVYALSLEGGAAALDAAKVAAGKQEAMATDEKWQLIMDFMEKYGYEQIFRNEKFAVYR